VQYRIKSMNRRAKGTLVTSIFLLENLATPPRAVALRSCGRGPTQPHSSGECSTKADASVGSPYPRYCGVSGLIPDALVGLPAVGRDPDLVIERQGYSSIQRNIFHMTVSYEIAPPPGQRVRSG